MKILTGFLLALSGSATAKAADPRLESVLVKAMDGDSPPAMGVLIIKRHRVAGMAVNGVRRLGSEPGVRIDDRWQLGSDVKAVTATLVARLVEKGVLAWDRPLARLLPAQAGAMHPAYRDVTLLDLLSHRSGLADIGADDPLFLAAYDDRRSLSKQRAQWAATLLKRPPAGPKRSQPRYANTGFVIAAAIAEAATGASYESLVRREVLRPLGMTSATFQAPRPGREPVGHVDGRPANARDANPPVMNPSSNLRLSLADWARFCLDQLRGAQGRGELLEAGSYRLLHAGQGGTEEGLGWGVAPDFAGRSGPVIQHTGHDGNWFAAVALFPNSGDGILLVANGGRTMGGERAVLRAGMTLMGTLSTPMKTNGADAIGR